MMLNQAKHLITIIKANGLLSIFTIRCFLFENFTLLNIENVCASLISNIFSEYLMVILLINII